MAVRLFGDRLEVAERFAGLLAGAGVERGLIGPREVDRLWERHLLNCALLIDAIPASARTLADVGSGAGLPGLVVAIAREDLEVTLIETMQRRALWLEEAAAELGVEVEVVRSRAEELSDRTFDVVTARAVAALDKLATWTLPLVADGGHLLAMKGSSAAEEIEAAGATLSRRGGLDPHVVVVGEGEVALPTTVVTVRRADRAPAEREQAGRSPRRGARRGRTSH
ncbi:16S rRNA (guanine(527)-N(7))-methyltransferase RsmG [Brachybacterium huguangmaarense]|uniref:Ribosomal RNA small subunit methyltransferase G n=1 Tax=Brachybacterium huguangmaarense TaxID=1652028 RepID=A0ABY6G344_9MICO|nr:16S rRNA (guanine(527)-N(7))-methyltransferase RsmG [Brachybacterium huguangmaarense]UYG17635.1 16S rRNA (guanine(527)-N(7))-methyltransferase RsmG [Brachybacterium huguangmaarense]